MAVHSNASAGYLTYNGGSVLDGVESKTIMCWARPQQVDQTNRILIRKRTGTTGWELTLGKRGGVDGTVEYEQPRATVDTFLQSGGSAITLDTDHFIAVQCANGAAELYIGSRTSPVVANSSAAHTDGTGTVTSEGTYQLTVGSRDSANSHGDAHISYVWIYDRVLSLVEIKAHQFNPNLQLAGCIFRTNHWNLQTYSGRDLTGTVTYGGVTGTPVVAPHIALHHPVSFLNGFSQGTLVAPTLGDIRRIMHHRRQRGRR